MDPTHTEDKVHYNKIIQFYSLRFQIEFNFRGAKQYWAWKIS